tara:strand:- start:514 stop:2343 length:1830 start_codon:yes stop_codon:yes gene_type:complete
MGDQKANNSSNDMGMLNTVKLANNMAQAQAHLQRIQADLAAFHMDPEGPVQMDPLNLGDTFKTFVTLMQEHPHEIANAQYQLFSQYQELCQNMMARMNGEQVEPLITPERGDRRFKDEGWNHDIFDFMKQAYLITAKWADATLKDIDGKLPVRDKRKVEFYAKQFMDALAPSNFMLTNPQVLREFMATSGDNIVRGLEQMAHDIERGKGKLNIKQTNTEAFEIGRNIAATKGSVVYRNDLCELLQYDPTTEEVYEKPILIIPPWINKYYILDLQEHNSMVKWLTDQGHTVFMVSWNNPDERLAHKTFDDYMVEGAMATIAAVEAATGVKKPNVVGYCIGGTMLACALSWWATKGNTKPVESATFLTTTLDFSDPGDLSVFVDETQLHNMEQSMEAHGGFLEGSEMATAFSMLRANDMIWSFVVNNYLLGKEPMAFDLLYWNSDPTRMPVKMHSFYLRHCYLQNDLPNKRMVLGGEIMDLANITVPVFMQAAREDHIATFDAVYKSLHHLGSRSKKFVLAASGHVAGVVNPPSAQKYSHWVANSTALPESTEKWLENTKELKGSWWPTWNDWLIKKAGKKIPARKPGDGQLKVLEPAPGSYVRKHSVPMN